jgi:hypothetical protein
MTLDEQIALATSHVEGGRRIIERQRILAARLRSKPSDDLLDLFERTQMIFEADLADLLIRKETASAPKRL